VTINVSIVLQEIQNESVRFLRDSVTYAVAKHRFMNPVTANPPKHWGGCSLLSIHDVCLSTLPVYHTRLGSWIMIPTCVLRTLSGYPKYRHNP
jgi:hypothetical protein